MINHIITLLNEKGYVLFHEKERGILIHETEQMIYIVTLSAFHGRLNVKLYQNMKQQAEFLAVTEFRKPVKTLHLIFTENGIFDEDIIRFVENTEGVWLIAVDTGRIYLFENQSEDFDGLYSYLEQELKEAEKSRKKQKRFLFPLKPVNIMFVVLNILYFLSIVASRGLHAVNDTNIMLEMGALNYESFVGGRWYEIITSLFMHFGISHLLNNMVLLLYVGCELEDRIGSLRYFILYLLAGICGNFASLWYYHSIGEAVVSAGASGAIFGVIGALFVVLLKQGKNSQNLTPKRLLFLAGITIYYGMTTIGVDNAAHIGGFLGGIISGFLLSKISQYGKLK